VRSVQRQIEAIERGDLDSVLALAHPEVTLDIFAPPEFPWIRRTRGIDELRRTLRHNFETVEDQRPEITNILAEGDAVVIFGRERGRFREGQRPYDVEFVQRFTFRDERLAALRIIVANTSPLD
jgi:ketosteroid isomerase-like protein